jgi:hypothetical protein
MTTLTSESLIATAEALLALADAIEPAAPNSFFGAILKPGEGWRQMLELAAAERLRFLAMEAPFGRYPSGAPKTPPAFDACVQLIDAATRECWPGPRGEPWSKWDYLPGIRQLGVGAPPPKDPKYPLERHSQQFEDDVHWLCSHDEGRAWLAHLENRAVTGADYVRLAGYKPVKRLPDSSLVEI